MNWDGYMSYFTSDLSQGVFGTENLNYYFGGWGMTIPGGTGEPGPAKQTYELTPGGARLLDEWAAALRRSRDRVGTFLERYEGR